MTRKQSAKQVILEILYKNLNEWFEISIREMEEADADKVAASLRQSGCLCTVRTLPDGKHVWAMWPFVMTPMEFSRLGNWDQRKLIKDARESNKIYKRAAAVDWNIQPYEPS